MKCPIDGTDLVMTERQGIEVDYCPKCRGVWLDRGELDKIIDRSAVAAPLPPDPQPNYNREPRRSEQHDQRYQETRDPRGKKGKSSFLGELFDF